MSRQTRLGRRRRLNDLRQRLRLCKKRNAQLREEIHWLRLRAEASEGEAVKGAEMVGALREENALLYGRIERQEAELLDLQHRYRRKR